jgi:hypothetical protein
VVNFDGKEDAVINALKLTLQPVDPIAINITSYTVGAPVRMCSRVPLDHWYSFAPFQQGPSSRLLGLQRSELREHEALQNCALSITSFQQLMP